MLDNRKLRQAVRMRHRRRRKARPRRARSRCIGRLETAAGLPIPLKTAVVRRREANAIALPGGHIYVFEGLVSRSRSPDELAGVIAHEIGHVAHRDGTRSLLQSAGLSFLFGMLLGDFTGGGVVVIAARTVVQSAYSREVEAAADRYGVQLMARIGGDARAFAAILERIAGAIEPGVKILLDHPQTKDRVAAIMAAAARPAGDAASRCSRRPNGPRSSASADSPWRAAASPTSRPRGWPSGRGAARCSRWPRPCSPILIVRSGILELVPALATFAGALLFAVIGIVLALGAFVVIWKDGIDGAGHAFSAIAIGLALIAYPAYLGERAYQAADDQRHHHRPDRSAALRHAGAAAPARHGRIRRPLRRRAAARGLSRHRAADASTATPQVAYDAAMQIDHRSASGAWWSTARRRPAGATARSRRWRAPPIMGFRDDVALRVRADGDGARIDVRSASRYGRHDFGTNAARIRSLLEDIDDADRATRDDEPRAAAAAEASRRAEGSAARQAIAAGDRGRAVGRDRAARHQILQMRQHRHAGGLDQPRIEIDVDRLRPAPGCRSRPCARRLRIEASRALRCRM